MKTNGKYWGGQVASSTDIPRAQKEDQNEDYNLYSINGCQ